MKPYIFVCDGMDDQLFEKLKSNSKVNVYPKSKIDRYELMENIHQANGLIVRSATTIDEELLEKATNLQIVIRAGTGVDNISIKQCSKKNVKVSNTPGANNQSAAELAIGLMFSALREIPLAHQTMTKGLWNKSEFVGSELCQKTIGIIGLGIIGKIIANSLVGFNPRIIYFDPLVSSDVNVNWVKMDSINELAKESDIITVHTPLIESTKNLLNQDFFNHCQKSPIVINAARGKIINEKEALEALNAKKISALALDVFEYEPLPESSPLRNHPKVILTPHIGASTWEAQERVGQMAIEQMLEYLIHNNLTNEVKG